MVVVIALYPHTIESINMTAKKVTTPFEREFQESQAQLERRIQQSKDEFNACIKLSVETVVCEPRESQKLRKWLNERCDAIEAASGDKIHKAYRNWLYDHFICQNNIPYCKDDNHTYTDTIFLFQTKSLEGHSGEARYMISEGGKARCNMIHHLCLAASPALYQGLQDLSDSDETQHIMSLLDDESQYHRVHIRPESAFDLPETFLFLPYWSLHKGGKLGMGEARQFQKWPRMWFTARDKKAES